MKKKPALPKLGTVPDYRHFWMLSFWILYLVLFFVVERLITTDYWVSYLPLDDKIPFCEYFIVPLLLASAAVFDDDLSGILRRGDVPEVYVVRAGRTRFGDRCLLDLPERAGSPAPPSSRGTTSLPGWSARIYAADTNTNVCPSMHVIGCVASSRPAVSRRGCAGGICSGS